MTNIDLLFSEAICTNAKISMKTVEDTKKESVSLVELIDDYASVKKVYDRVRYWKQKESHRISSDEAKMPLTLSKI